MGRNLCIYKTRSYNREKLSVLHNEIFGTDTGFLFLGTDDNRAYDRAIVGFEVTTGALIYDYEKMYDCVKPTKADWKAEDSDEDYEDWAYEYAVSMVDDILRWMPYHAKHYYGYVKPVILNFSTDPMLDMAAASDDDEISNITYVRKPYPKEVA